MSQYPDPGSDAFDQQMLGVIRHTLETQDNGLVERILADPNISRDDRDSLILSLFQESLNVSAWDLAKFCVQHGGMEPESADPIGPFYDAFSRLGDCPEVIQFLLDQGASVERRDTNNDTPLHLAARHRWIKSAEVLLRNGAKVDADTVIDQGETSLMIAASSADLEMIELLLDYGADPRKQDRYSRTAIEYARLAKHPTIAQYLESYHPWDKRHKKRRDRRRT